MGNCGGKKGHDVLVAERKVPEYDKPMRSPRAQPQKRSFKLLLLGAGESGKSTFFKQLVLRYGNGFTDRDRRDYIVAIIENTILSMQVLVYESRNLSKQGYPCAYDARNEDAANYILTLDVVDQIDSTIADAIQQLWADPGIKYTYKLRSKFQIPDTASYFFDWVQNIANPNYLPSNEDILRCRDRSTGVNESEFEINSDRYLVVDVGGQRAERKKWVHCFQHVKTVIFIVAISEYDQLCFEDEETNRVREALLVFDTVCNSEWFKTIPIVLLFNKKDLFSQKIVDEEIPLSVCFPDYPYQPGNYEAATNYVINKFKSTNKSDKPVYPHFICATQGFEDIEKVFSSMKELVQQYNTQHHLE